MIKLYPFQLFLLVSVTWFQYTNAQKYKEMMNDNRYNFYEVVEEATTYFSTIDKNAKGSGFKPFMRWAVSNEYKYYPSGNRLTVDPEFVIKSYQKKRSK